MTVYLMMKSSLYKGLRFIKGVVSCQTPDIDSDSYVLCLCKTDNLRKLTELAKSINHRIDFAKNM